MPTYRDVNKNKVYKNLTGQNCTKEMFESLPDIFDGFEGDTEKINFVGMTKE